MAARKQGALFTVEGPESSARGFEDMAWLFACDNRNRRILRQNFDEAALLWKCVKATRGSILEIGRLYAGSTVFLAAAAGDRKVVSIDIGPKHHPSAERYLFRPGVRERVELIVGDSRRSLPGRKFGMLFIDGDHSEEGVTADTAAHWASLEGVDGAPPLAVFHDAVPNPGLEHCGAENHFEGVRILCERLVELGVAAEGPRAGSVQVLQKLAELPAGFGARVAAAV